MPAGEPKKRRHALHSCQEEIERMLLRCSDTVLEEVRYENHFDLDKALAGANFDEALSLREEDAYRAAQVLTLRDTEHAEPHLSPNVQFEPIRAPSATPYPDAADADTIPLLRSSGAMPQRTSLSRFLVAFLQFCREECVRGIAHLRQLLPPAWTSRAFPHHTCAEAAQGTVAGAAAPFSPNAARAAIGAFISSLMQREEREAPQSLAHALTRTRPHREDNTRTPIPRLFIHRALTAIARADLRRLAAWAFLTWLLFTVSLAVVQWW